MEAYKRLAILAMLLAAVAVAANGKSSGFCGMDEDGLNACKPSVRAQSPVPPSAACCASISKADFPCLCGFRNSALLPYLGIDPTMAMQLPAKCNFPNPVTC